MKKYPVIVFVIRFGFLPFIGFSQTEPEPELLGLPGDDLDLDAVLGLFQKSKTIEDFEKALNDENTGINNLDMNNDDQVDFIKVETKQNGDDFKFILQVPINEKKNQDVAVINLKKDKDSKVSLEIVGDKDLYGKDYVINARNKENPGVTPNPAYIGDDPVEETLPASTVVVVESAPIVTYVYSPGYAPYYSPYYYGYYPPYYRPYRPVARAIYWDNRYDRYDDYWDDRQDMYDDRQDNRNDRQDNRGDRVDTRPSQGGNTDRPTAGTGDVGRTSGRPSAGTSQTARPSSSPSVSTSQAARPSASPSNLYSSSGRSSSSYARPQTSTGYQGGGRSMSSGGMNRASTMSRGGGGRRR